MKKAVVVLLLIVGACSALAFEIPTDDQILAAAADPAQLEALLKGARSEQAVDILNRVIKVLENTAMEPDQIKSRMEALLSQIQVLYGEQAPEIISQIAGNINPAYLPEVSAPPGQPVAPLGLPIALPLAPPIAPRYSGQ